MDDSLARRLTLAELRIAELTVRLKVARDSARRYRDLLGRRRVPVVLEVHANGDVMLYAENGTVEVAVVEWPDVEWSATVEEWLGWQLGERHRAVYLPSCVEARVAANAKRLSLTAAYGKYERMLADFPLVRAMVAASKESRKDFDAPKKTTDRRAATRKRGT